VAQLASPEPPVASASHYLRLEESPPEARSHWLSEPMEEPPVAELQSPEVAQSLLAVLPQQEA
jgi:hypothetical protein